MRVPVLQYMPISEEIQVPSRGEHDLSERSVRGRAKLRRDSLNGADAYIIVRNGSEITGPLRIEGSQKELTDKSAR